MSGILTRWQGPILTDSYGQPILRKNGMPMRRAGRAPRGWTPEQQPNGGTPGFTLTAKQQEAIHLLGGPQRYTMLKGGARSGKTFLLIRAMLIRAIKAPESRHVVFRLRFNAAKESLWLDTIPKVHKLCFPQVPMRMMGQDHYVQLPNRSEVWIGGLDDKDRVEKILGKEFCTIYFNECSQIPYGSILLALTRLSQKIPNLVNRGYFDINPTTTGHWSNRLFIQKRRIENQEFLTNPGDYAYMTINPEDNATNIDPVVLQELRNLPTRQRQRFYSGEYVSEIPGQLWTLEIIEKCRVSPEDVPPMRRIVIPIDPSGASGPDDIKADEIGNVPVGLGVDGKAYVLEDLTGLHSPEQWGRIAVNAFRHHRADRIIGEKNYGGDMVRAVIHSVDKAVPYKEVHATRGKAVRAEPISALFEQDMVRIVGHLPVLEEQLTNFLTSGYYGMGSPNNADAMIWGLTELFNKSYNECFPIVSVTKGGDGLERASGWHMESSAGRRWGGE